MHMPLVAGWGIECKKSCAFPLPLNKLRGPSLLFARIYGTTFAHILGVNPVAVGHFLFGASYMRKKIVDVIPFSTALRRACFATIFLIAGAESPSKGAQLQRFLTIQ